MSLCPRDETGTNPVYYDCSVISLYCILFESPRSRLLPTCSYLYYCFMWSPRLGYARFDPYSRLCDQIKRFQDEQVPHQLIISSWITRDHLFVKKNPTRHLLLIKLMNGNYPPTEFPFDFIIIYCEILFKKSYPISLHEKRNYQKTSARPLNTLLTEQGKSTLLNFLNSEKIFSNISYTSLRM